MPSPELYNLPPPSPSTPSSHHTPHWAQDKAARLTKITVNTIDNCKDQLPSPLEGDGTLTDSLRETLTKVMNTCSQLALCDSYLEHRKDKVNLGYTLIGALHFTH